MAKQLNTRIQLKHDFEANWIIAGENSNFVPKSGEMIIYDAEVDSEGNLLTIDEKTATLPEGRDTYYAHPRMKIGDGVTNVNNLPFSSSVSSGDGVNRTYDHRLYADGNDAYIMFQSYVDGELESDAADQIVISGSEGIGVSVDASNKIITLTESSNPYHAGTSAPTNTNLLWIDTTSVTGGLKYYNGSDWVTVPVRFS